MNPAIFNKGKGQVGEKKQVSNNFAQKTHGNLILLRLYFDHLWHLKKKKELCWNHRGAKCNLYMLLLFIMCVILHQVAELRCIVGETSEAMGSISLREQIKWENLR